MYLVEKLSAAKIARAYGLDEKYKSAKVAESTVLYQLKRNGIQRRSSTAHVRKIGEQLVDEWVKRYTAGESLKKIAGSAFSPVSVMLHLKRRGIPRREKVRAQIKALTIHRRTPFGGELEEMAYLIGFAIGDLHVSRHGRAVRVKTSSTHPRMLDLFNELFSPYGHVFVAPRLSELAGYEWDFQVDLDNSFSFLLEAKARLPDWIFAQEFFPSFAAGFFDAEGSLWLKASRIRGFEASYSNSDRNLLERISQSMTNYDIRFHLSPSRNSSVWHLRLWRIDEVQHLLRMLPLRHPEKVKKASIFNLIVNTESPVELARAGEAWEELLGEIESERDVFVARARNAIETAKIVNGN